MTEPMQSTALVPARGRGRQARGGRWRTLYDAMASFKPGDILSYEEMGQLLDLDFLDRKDKTTINVVARKAARELHARENMVFRIVRGLGYQVAQPSQVIEMAHQHQARAVAEVEAGHAKIETIDVTTVDVTMARMVEATALAFARQAVMMRQLDVRQQRLELAMEAVNATAHAAIRQAEETANRLTTSQTEMADLDRRLATLEAGRRSSSHTTDSLPRPARR